MSTSTPKTLEALKDLARLIRKKEGVPLHEAQRRAAVRAGFAHWHEARARLSGDSPGGGAHEARSVSAGPTGTAATSFATTVREAAERIIAVINSRHGVGRGAARLLTPEERRVDFGDRISPGSEDLVEFVVWDRGPFNWAVGLSSDVRLDQGATRWREGRHRMQDPAFRASGIFADAAVAEMRRELEALSARAPLFGLPDWVYTEPEDGGTLRVSRED